MSSKASLFSDAGQAAAYSQFRPSYRELPELFEAILRSCPGRELAVDIATGSGQAAVAVAGHFAKVIAQDGSEAQLQHANRVYPNVQFELADACTTGLPDGCADLVTVAQALHWFHGPAFYKEVRRILKQPTGCFAAWSYATPVLVAPDHPAQAVLQRFYEGLLGPFWVPERRHVERGYAGIEPVAGQDFSSVQRLAFQHAMQQTVDQLCGYLSSWSAYRTYLQQHPGQDPLPGVQQQLLTALGARDGAAVVTVITPLTLLLCTGPC